VNFGVIVALVLGLLSPALVPAHAGDTFVRSVLTDEGPHYAYRYDGDRLVISAGEHDADWNRREVFHRPDAPVTRNQTTCATWAAQTSDMAQEGLAVRIRENGHRTRAVTLTKNTIFHVHWTFNLLTWDTARDGDPWRWVEQYDMSSAVARSVHHLYRLPWRVCLRVTGDQVAFKVWPLGRVSRPGWNDPTYSRHAELPRAFDHPGRAGWYVGHVPSGGHLVYRGLSTSA
jgi:hypothetical protein